MFCMNQAGNVSVLGLKTQSHLCTEPNHSLDKNTFLSSLVVLAADDMSSCWFTHARTPLRPDTLHCRKCFTNNLQVKFISVM